MTEQNRTVVEIDPNKQYYLLGDISASVGQQDDACGGNTRYGYMLEKFGLFIQTAEDFDPTGPTVILFGGEPHVYPDTSYDAVQANLAAVQFEGFTNTHLALAAAHDLHKAKGGKSVAMIFTDGAPTNRRALRRKIVEIANGSATDDEFSVIILTVGTIDTELAEYLRQLDEELRGEAQFDIVDVKRLEDVSFMAAVDGAFND